MISSAHDYPIQSLLNSDKLFFSVPKYQREYVWGISDWKTLFEDVLDNDSGYYLGSMICINKTTDSVKPSELEVIDGQQRLTTIMILLAAVYNRLSQYEDDVKNHIDYVNYLTIRKIMIFEQSPNKLRLVPQSQNNNSDDFRSVMSDAGLCGYCDKQPNYGNRRIAKCYKYFCESIDAEFSTSEKKIDSILSLLKKIFNLILIKIEVSSESEAYVMFESINNTGQPLTAVDLIKNSILSKAEISGSSVDDFYEIWKNTVNNLGDNYTVQERFFRQYYNAFRDKLNSQYACGDNEYPLGRLMTKSNLLLIYEKIISKDCKQFLNDIYTCSGIYSHFINLDDSYSEELSDLEHVQAAPAYQLLLYVFKSKDEWCLKEADIKSLIVLLSKFFIRRNITDTPGTRDLIRLFTGLISDLEIIKTTTNDAEKPNILYKCVHDKLVQVSASDDLFTMKLQGNMYEDNISATRYVLCALCEKEMNTETTTDLWKKEIKGNSNQMVYVWTIEHIFPEGENIPETWVKMIADGKYDLAKQYHKKYVHTIGNLTITGYNSKLGNKSFEEKKDRVNDKGHYIGYRNGLAINADVVSEDKWTVDTISKRTTNLVGKIVKYFAL